MKLEEESSQKFWLDWLGKVVSIDLKGGDRLFTVAVIVSFMHNCYVIIILIFYKE